MILYRPTDGDPHTKRLSYRPKTCFVMTQMGEPLSLDITQIRKTLSKCLSTRGISELDANSVVTGKDFLLKIWGIIITVPLGIAIITKDISPQTLANIFYEIGMLQAYGKETLVIKTKDARVPSDFVRTEYINYDRNCANNIDKFLETLFSMPEYFETMAEQLENDPLLSIDYLRRAYLISGDEQYKKKAEDIYKGSTIEKRAKNSVEMLLLGF